MERKDFNLEMGKKETSWIQDFINELLERLEKMEEVLVVDRIEGDIAVCENRENGKMKEILVSDLPENAKEGSIIKWENGTYILDTSNEIQERIAKKMKNLWE